MDAAARITRTLERLAERDIDLVPAVYARFFERCPQARPLFADGDIGGVHGKMLNEVIRSVLDMAEGKPYISTLLETEINDHDNWGVTVPMYDALFSAILDALAEALPEGWDAPTQHAWQARFAEMAALAARHSRHPG